MATVSHPFRSFLQTQQEISPQRWKPRHRSGSNCLFKQRCHQGATASPHQSVEGSFLSHVPPGLRARQGWEEELVTHHTGALLLLPTSDTSLDVLLRTSRAGTL